MLSEEQFNRLNTMQAEIRTVLDHPENVGRQFCIPISMDKLRKWDVWLEELLTRSQV
jgi:hypothetical protein